MVRSLWFKLMGAFGLVILVGVALVMFVTLRATAGQFQLYVIRTGGAWAQNLAPALADYYARTGSWQGVDTILQSSPSGMMMGGRMHQGGTGSGNMWAVMGNRLLLADASGTVVADTAGELPGMHVTDSDLARGAPITVNGRQVGTLMVAALDVPASAADDFLRSVNTSLLLGGLLSGIVALAMGSLLFYQIITPMRKLSRAAQGIASGDLSQRVPLSADDEVGQLGRSFNTMAESLQQMERQRQNMVADIAHELRTPLTVIQGNVEAMLDGVLPASHEELESIHQETLLLNRLVTDLRTLSLAEAGQLALDRQPLDLTELLTRVAEKFRLRAEKQQVTLNVEVASSLLTVSADAGRIEQVIANLVDNALCHGGSASGGRVTLGARGVPGGVEIQVSDTGPGFLPEELTHVFERFWRADKSQDGLAGGSGIGLALVKQLTEAHGGRVSVESAPGQGATFHVTFHVI